MKAEKVNKDPEEAACVYHVDELAECAQAVFGKDVRSECVKAAFHYYDVENAGIQEAKKLVEAFMRRGMK